MPKPSLRLWTIPTLSAYLQIKPSTLYAWVAQGKIPALHIHRLIRFDAQEIYSWLQQFREHSRRTPERGRGLSPKAIDLDRLIARVKAQVYTAGHGKPDGQSSPSAKGGTHGAL